MSVRQILPAFTRDGVLPVGDYVLTPDELRGSMLVHGPQGVRRGRRWDASWRSELVENVLILADQLWQVGVRDVFLDGSFVEDKDHPNDIDGYFNCDLKDLATGVLQERLNQLDPLEVWDWSPASRKPVPGTSKPQLPMWRAYRVELFPHVGQSSGIRDRFGNELDFPAAFRLSRDGVPKGIIKVVPDHDSKRR